MNRYIKVNRNNARRSLVRAFFARVSPVAIEPELALRILQVSAPHYWRAR